MPLVISDQKIHEIELTEYESKFGGEKIVVFVREARLAEEQTRASLIDSLIPDYTHSDKMYFSDGYAFTEELKAVEAFACLVKISPEYINPEAHQDQEIFCEEWFSLNQALRHFISEAIWSVNGHWRVNG